MTNERASSGGKSSESDFSAMIQEIAQEEITRDEPQGEESSQEGEPDISSDSDSSTTAKPENKQIESDDDAFSELFGKDSPKTPEKTKDERRKESAQKQFESFSQKLLVGEKDFYELSPWIQKGVVDTLLERVESEEIEIDDLPDEVQEKIFEKMEKRSLLSKKNEKEIVPKHEHEKAIKIAELKHLSREIPKEIKNDYLNALRDIMAKSPSFSAEEAHKFAKYEIGFFAKEGVKGINIVPSRQKARENMTSGNFTENSIKNSSDEEFISSIYGNKF
jgi:hypothetical protein